MHFPRELSKRWKCCREGHRPFLWIPDETVWFRKVHFDSVLSCSDNLVKAVGEGATRIKADHQLPLPLCWQSSCCQCSCAYTEGWGKNEPFLQSCELWSLSLERDELWTWNRPQELPPDNKDCMSWLFRGNLWLWITLERQTFFGLREIAVAAASALKFWPALLAFLVRGFTLTSGCPRTAETLAVQGILGAVGKFSKDSHQLRSAQNEHQDAARKTVVATLNLLENKVENEY